MATKEAARQAAIDNGLTRYKTERPCPEGHTERYAQTGICCVCQQKRTKGNKKPRYLGERYATVVNTREAPQITNPNIYTFEFRSVVRGEREQPIIHNGLGQHKLPSGCACLDIGGHSFAQCESLACRELPTK